MEDVSSRVACEEVTVEQVCQAVIDHFGFVVIGSQGKRNIGDIVSEFDNLLDCKVLIIGDATKEDLFAQHEFCMGIDPLTMNVPRYSPFYYKAVAE